MARMDAKLVGTTEEELKKALDCQKEVWDLLKKDGKLNIPKDDIFLLRFVRAKKYNSEVVVQSLKKYYDARRKFAKQFENFYPSRYRHVLESGIIGLLKNRDDLQRKTFVFRVSKWDPDVISFEDITIACVLVAEQMSWCPVNQCHGAVILIDENGLGLAHARQCTLPAMHKLIVFMQDNFPGRYKALHLVNQPYVLDLFCNLVKRFIAKRLQSRVKLHRDAESLTELVSPDILPKSLGGNLEEDDAFDDELVPAMLRMENYYKELAKYGFV
ncbi:retinaldehyde-binding protein 1 [Folsomia candida]|uniref:Retinaldehyde-binding protein 1 n=1 Tax=Folsomia candida TaxID=158441 RepID=A0A226ER85_FOLCA|nr:retinaldehyde-binding protein 1 [Folsomia candida]OXA59770.1 Retinaldehyde-binding protein 1 [Folsomia candida]